MTTFINSEGKFSTYTTKFIETVLLQKVQVTIITQLEILTSSSLR